MKIVVTGALGHIGSKLIRQLPTVCSDVEILMVDNLSTQRYCSLFDLPNLGEYAFLEGDVLQLNLESILEKADCAVHLAALTDAENSIGRLEEVERVNLGGTTGIAQACARLGCPLIFASTTSVYGIQDGVVTEDCAPSQLRAQSPYALVKLKEESLLHELGSDAGLRFTICRFGTICGTSPGMRFHTAVNKFCWQAVMGQPLTVWRTALDQKRPYLDLNDAVAAICFVISRRLFANKIYNIVTENLSVRQILHFIRQRVPSIEVELVDSKIMNQLSYEVSNARFNSEGFRFSGGIEDQVCETLDLLSLSGVPHSSD